MCTLHTNALQYVMVTIAIISLYLQAAAKDSKAKELWAAMTPASSIMGNINNILKLMDDDDGFTSDIGATDIQVQVKAQPAVLDTKGQTSPQAQPNVVRRVFSKSFSSRKFSRGPSMEKRGIRENAGSPVPKLDFTKLKHVTIPETTSQEPLLALPPGTQISPSVPDATNRTDTSDPLITVRDVGLDLATARTGDADALITARDVDLNLASTRAAPALGSPPGHGSRPGTNDSGHRPGSASIRSGLQLSAARLKTGSPFQKKHPSNSDSIKLSEDSAMGKVC